MSIIQLYNKLYGEKNRSATTRNPCEKPMGVKRTDGRFCRVKGVFTPKKESNIMYLYEIKRRRNGRCVGNDFAQNIDDECVYIYAALTRVHTRLTHFNRLPCFRLSPRRYKRILRRCVIFLSFYLIHFFLSSPVADVEGNRYKDLL